VPGSGRSVDGRPPTHWTATPPAGVAAAAYLARWSELIIGLSYLWEGQVLLAERVLRPALLQAAADLGRRTAKEARRVYRIGEFYGSADETLAQNGFAPNRVAGQRGLRIAAE